MPDKMDTFRPVYGQKYIHPRVFFIFCLLISGLLFLSVSTRVAIAATYYCDPVDGNTATGNGSAANPWGTFQSIIEAGKIQRRQYPDGNISNPTAPVAEGDTIKLLSGYHGCFSNYTGWHFLADYLTIEAADNNTPRIGRVNVSSFAYWKFSDILFDYESYKNNGGSYDNGHVFRINITTGFGTTNHIIIENCILRTVSDANSTDWDANDWKSNLCEAGIYAKGTNYTISGNSIHNIKTGLTGPGSDSLVENNTITQFAGDCIQSSGSNITFQDNICKNAKCIGHSHRDFFDASGTLQNFIFQRNIFIEYEDPNQDFCSHSLHGYFLDTNNTNCTIQNNLVLCDYPYGIYSEADCIGLKVLNNTVVSAPQASNYHPAIIVARSALSSDCIIRNNISHNFPDQNESRNIDVDHNIDIDEHGGSVLFVDYSNYDFNLKIGSPAIDTGSDVNAPSDDILGNNRPQGNGYDIGCYEYISKEPNNSAPVLDTIGNKSVNENSTLSFSVNAIDDDNDTITYSAQNLPRGATFVGQTFSWTPDYNQAKDYPVTFIASDSHQAQDSETITITVNNVNRAPVLEAIGNKSVDENSTLSLSVSATDADNDTITYSVDNLPSGAAFASQTFTWTPSYNQAGPNQVMFVASDGHAQDSETITITVNNVNRAPVLSTIGNQSVYTDDSLTFTVSATDPDGDAITYSAEDLPGGATFANQIFNWTPDDSQVGSPEVTFIASDGQAQDSETVTITVSTDTSKPSVTNCSPAAGDIQVPLNNLIILHIVDTGKGVDANSVTIKVNNSIVYTGNTADYSSEYGHYRRVGTKADYTFIYQANDAFNFDQTVTVTVNATDLAGNVMNEYSYSFKTEMRSFGKNKKVNSGSDSLSKDNPTTARDTNGNIWVAWHAGQTGSRDIYVGKLTAGTDSFESNVQLTNNSADQCNAAIAIDADNKLYIVWQDNRYGNWDIYISTSVGGTNWSTERPVVDSNGNQTNPAIIIDGSSSKTAYVVFEDDQADNQDIYVASSSNDFGTKTVSRITSDSSDQTEPAIAVDFANTVYVVWTDARGSSNNIYGAASNNGPWTNVAIVSNTNNQSSPAIAAEADGSILHLLWVDETPSDRDIYYASSNGLPGSPLTGNTIIDDTSSSNQLEPAIAVTGSTGNSLKVFACWQDERNSDTDLYFLEVSSGSETNVLVGDDGTNANQSNPAIGVDIHGHPYIVWADNRNTNTDIYYAGSTFVESNALTSKNVSASSGATVGTAPADSVDDVSVIVPAGAYACDIKITISRVKNPATFTVECFSLPYEFGPSGINFDRPVTITIPYEVPSSDNSTSAYWYNPLTGSLSQQGITDIEDIVISSSLHALRFKTTHLTQFVVGGTTITVEGGGGGGGGGGCAMSSNSQGSIVEFLLPYVGYIMVLMVIKYRDALKLKARNTARSKC